MKPHRLVDTWFWSLAASASSVAVGVSVYELYCVASGRRGKTISGRAHKQIVNHQSTAFIITVAASFLTGLLMNHLWETHDIDVQTQKGWRARFMVEPDKVRK